jgi:hypothetical protein
MSYVHVVESPISNQASAKTLQLLLFLRIITDELPQDVTPANQIIHLLRRQVSLRDQSLKPLQLLRRIILVRNNLVPNLDIVLRILVLQRARNRFSLLGTISIAALELRDNGVEGLDGTTSSIQTTANGTVRTGIAVEEVDEIFLRACAFVRERFGGTLGEVFDGGVG